MAHMLDSCSAFYEDICLISECLDEVAIYYGVKLSVRNFYFNKLLNFYFFLTVNCVFMLWHQLIQCLDNALKYNLKRYIEGCMTARRV